MKLETYLKLKELFMKQYEDARKSDFGHAHLKDFSIRNFKRFIFIFSHDLPCSFTNVVSSIAPVKFMVRRGTFADKIRIDGTRSVLERFPEQLDQINDYYNKLTR